MLSTIKMINRARKTPLDYAIIPTMFDKRTKAAIKSLNTLRGDYPNNVWSKFIPIDTKLREASSVGVPASIYDPSSRAVACYSDLLDELLAQQRSAKPAV